MYPVENQLLSRLLVEERLRKAEQNQHLRLAMRQQTPRFMRMRLWLGERLIHLGNRLMTPTTHYRTPTIGAV